MAKENEDNKKDCRDYMFKRGKDDCRCYGNRGGGDAVYGIGLIGALIYFIGNSHSFTQVLWAIVKALVWPGVLVYHLLQFLHL